MAVYSVSNGFDEEHCNFFKKKPLQIVIGTIKCCDYFFLIKDDKTFR